MRHITDPHLSTPEDAQAYESLLAALRKDLQLDAQTDLLAGTVFSALQASGLFLPARAYLNTAGNTGAINTTFALAVDTLDFDLTGGAMDVTNHWFKCPAAGYYLLAGNLAVSATSDDGHVLLMGFMKNGTLAQWASGSGDPSTATSINLFTGGATIMKCAAGDEIQLGYQSNVAGKAFEIASSVNYLTVMRVA